MFSSASYLIKYKRVNFEWLTFIINYLETLETRTKKPIGLLVLANKL